MKRILWTALILASASPAFAEPIWKFDQSFVGNPDDKLVAVEVSLNLNDALGGPAALIVVFDGAIVQVDAQSEDGPAAIDQSAGGSGVGATRTDTSAAWDYDKSTDSWFYFGVGTGSAANTTALAWRGPIDAVVDGVQWAGIAGGEVGSTSFRMAAGSGSGATGLVPGDIFIPVAHLVIDLKAGGAGGEGGAANPNRMLSYTWQTGHASADGTTALQFPAGGGFQTDTFRLIPEPSSFVLAGLGAVALLGLARRRRAA